MLGRIAGAPGCLLVAGPDVVGQAQATRDLFAQWQPILAALGLPVALVGQDGAAALSLPWGRFQALFLGGSTAWKLGPGAAQLAAEAKRRGWWVHLGRCNTRPRFCHAFRLGCDSIDGSGISRWPDERIPTALRWLAELHGTDAPDGGHRNLAHRFRQASAAEGRSLRDQDGWRIDAVTQTATGYLVRARYAPEPLRCPCGGVADLPAGAFARHGRRGRVVRDVPRHGQAVRIVVERQRYRCRVCGHTFLQPLPGLSGQGALSENVAKCLRRQAATQSRLRVARAAGVDEKTVRNLLGRSTV